MRFRILLTALLALGAIGALAAQDAAPAKPANVAGDWEMTTQSPQGDMTADAAFVQDGDKIKFASSVMGMEMTGEGRSRARTSNGP